MMSTTPQAAAFWCALLMILLLVLAFRVIGQRRTHQVLLGDGGKDGLIVAQRAFANAAEYVPAAMAALVLITVLHGSVYVVHLIGALLFIGRVLHAWGMNSEKLTAGRMGGMILTFAAYAIAIVALLITAFR